MKPLSHKRTIAGFSFLMLVSIFISATLIVEAKTKETEAQEIKAEQMILARRRRLAYDLFQEKKEEKIEANKGKRIEQKETITLAAAAKKAEELARIERVEAEKKRQAEIAEQERLNAIAKAKAAEEEAAKVQAEKVANKKTTEKTESTKVEAQSKTKTEPSKKSKAPITGKRFVGTFQATAYAVGAWGVPGTRTANGTDISNTIYSPEGYRIVAVDTRVIPMNSIVEVHVPGWAPFIAKASDTGGMIKGNIIDILMSSPQEGLNFGRQNGIEIYIINK